MMKKEKIFENDIFDDNEKLKSLTSQKKGSGIKRSRKSLSINVIKLCVHGDEMKTFNLTQHSFEQFQEFHLMLMEIFPVGQTRRRYKFNCTFYVPNVFMRF